MGTSLYEQFQREQAGADEPASLYEQYRAEQAKPATKAPLNLPKFGADATSALPHNRPDASGDFEVIGRAAAGNLANIAQGLPGMRAVQAGARAAVRGQPYREALSDIDAATNAIPAPLRIAERMAGAAPLAALLPASTVAQAAKSGAALGAADQALDANPDLSLGERAAHTATGAAIGGATGAALAGGVKALDKGREMVGLAKRVKNATPLDEAAVADAKATRAADIANYGKAASEAEAAGGTSPGLREELDHPTTKPFVDMVRASERGTGADDAKLAREAYKLMSRQRRGLQQRMATNGYDAKMDLEADDLAAGMRRLKDAVARPSRTPVKLDVAPELVDGEQVVRIDTPKTSGGEEVSAVMPSFPPAVAEHARMKGNRAAFETAAERTNKIMRGARVPAKKLGTESPAAWMEQILGMSPEEADAALRGTLGEAKGQAGYRLPRDASIVGAIKELGGPAQRLNRIAPFVRALDQQAGSAPFQPMNLQQYLRYLATLNGPIANP